MRWKLVSYLAVFAVAGLLAGTIYRFIDRGTVAWGCRQYSHPDAFVAGCDTPQFGDYEHGAYYLGLEPEALRHLGKAEVLMLGNSATQFAFSTDATRQFFEQRSIPFYSFGFGFGEVVNFPSAIIKQQRLRPKVLIINTGPFFSPGWSEPAKQLASDEVSWGTRFLAARDYLEKKVLMWVHPTVCARFAHLCSDKFRTLYRSKKNGVWIWRNILTTPDGGVPVAAPNKYIHPRLLALQDQPRAAEFLKLAGVSAECVILTVIPNSVFITEPYAFELGHLLGIRVFLPQLEGLATLDSAHLNWSSAERWASAFFEQVADLIEKCTDRASASHGLR